MTALADLTAYKATYKSHVHARTTKTLGVFFAESHAMAESYATRVVERETFGAGWVICVEPTEDPRTT